MTQAFNLAQLANNLNSSGQLDATDGLTGLVTNANLASSGSASSSTYLRGDRTWAALPALGKVLQVITFQFTSTFGTNTNVWQDVGISVSITPSSTSSRILVLGNINVGQDNGNIWGLRMLRNGTLVNYGQPNGAAGQGLLNMTVRDTYAQTAVPITYLDSPATTSSCTYKIQCITESGYAFYINRPASDLQDNRQQRSASNLTVLEIGA